jgi:hypothetical protein
MIRGVIDKCRKWSVCRVATSNRSRDGIVIRALMDRQFGWAKIADIARARAAAQCRVNEKFAESWKVHVVKLRPSSLSSADV